MSNQLSSRSESEEHWISISDVMSGLMMMFMFIAISYMINVQKEKEQIEEIAETYIVLKEDIYRDLAKEFDEDLIKWNAEIDPQTLSVRFKEPDVFFAPGKSELKLQFEVILTEFFPRYIKILHNEKYRDEIEEVRIEGHTSSAWYKLTGTLQAYYNNMELSQDRTRSVLEYCLTLNDAQIYQTWLIENLTANGLSYSHRIMIDGKEDYKKSRRVEFKIRTKAEKRIEQILNSKADETT
jgi:outer membrane protein OmpA-like peptidoglycan-associated protein